MDLLRLLEIDRSLIPPEAQRSLLIAEMVWSNAGSPQDRAGLCAALEKTLQSCTRQGIWYAAVLLQRKKSLERGSWRPLAQLRRQVRQVQGPRSERISAALPVQMDDSDACSECRGSGIITAPGGKSGTFCSCGIYLTRLRKSTQENENATSSR
jgi:hypothetical protein